MSRTVRDAKLESRTARLALKSNGGKPHWRALAGGLHIGYRKNISGGKWVVRQYIGGEQPYKTETLDGVADDHGDADDISVLSYAQAQDKAWKIAKGVNAAAAGSTALTVQAACEDYVKFLRSHKKTADDAELRLRKWVYPDIKGRREEIERELADIAERHAKLEHLRSERARTRRENLTTKEAKLDGELKALPHARLGDKIVADLTKDDVEHWLESMVRRDESDPEVERRSKDSANRVLSMVKAALNRIFDDVNKKKKFGILSDYAWRRAKPFKDVSRAREVHLDRQQVTRLLNTTSGAFRNLLTAALLTGARPPHELVELRVRDFDSDHGTLTITRGKTGARIVTLSKEATLFFSALAAGKHPDALLLPRDNGEPWGKNHHARLMQEAVERAKLPQDTTVYSLRHTHISDAIITGMPLTLLAENCGTSVRMIETNYAKAIAATRATAVEQYGYKLGLKAGKKVAKLESARRKVAKLDSARAL